MKKLLLIGLLTLVLAAPLLTIAVQKALADPDPVAGKGYIYDVSPSPGMEMPGSKKWKVQQGVTVTVTLKEVELSLVDVWVAGSYMDGTSYKFKVLNDYVVVGGTVVFSFTVPATAACTGVFQSKNWDEKGELHVAAVYSISEGKQEAGGYKVYYSDWNPVACSGVPGVPEFSTASAVVTSIGLIAAFAVRRYQKK